MSSVKEFLDKVYHKGEQEFFRLLNGYLVDDKRLFVVTANPETMMQGERNAEFGRLLLDEETVIVPDGIGVVKAAAMVGNPVQERVTGVDISKKLLKLGNEEKKSIYLYGAKPEVLQALTHKIETEYPGLCIAGARDGYQNQDEEVFADILKKKPDIILVALGIPRQELLINRYFKKLEKGICVGVGGTFDVLSGTKKRAPKIFIKLNLEWFYRLLKEPKRIGRFYHNNVTFIKEIKKIKK